MNGDTRYTISLTSTDPRVLPLPRVMWRYDDQAATEAAERELRRHRNTWGQSAKYDGWRLRKHIPGNPKGQLVAEVRPGYDSRKAHAQTGPGPAEPPF